MRFGYFDDKSREYVITRPDTPLPWINYLGTDSFFGLISNTAGGYSFYKDARLRRLTRYRYNNAPLDMGGRYIYLRDADSGEIWSPSWMPTRVDLDSYECRHGMGYTVITSKKKGVEARIRYFVPLNLECEVWDVTLANEREDEVNLDLFSAVEFALWDAWDDSTNFQRNFNTGEVEVPDLHIDPDGGDVLRGTIFHKTEYRERRNHFAYFACSEPLNGFDTQRDAFLGPNRGWDRPLVVESGQSKNSIAHGWQPIGSHHLELHLKPGEAKRVIFLLGYHENSTNEKFDPADSNTINKAGVLPVIREFLSLDRVDKAFEELREYWKELLSKFTVVTPDEDTNRMVNIWNAYQCMVTFNMSRSASYFESGVGRGLGFRDSSQDLLGFVHQIPERARERILDIAATQFRDGGCYHQYQPLTKKGNNDIGGGFNDDPLWLIAGTAAYIKETGDYSILDEPTAYDCNPDDVGTLLEHLTASFYHVVNNKGPHNLPLIGRADWNDCLNLNCHSTAPGESFQTFGTADGRVAESVLIAGMFVAIGPDLVTIYNKKGMKAEADKAQAEIEEMKKTVLDSGWDGEWFVRAYDAFGSKIGSNECEEGKIFIESQGYCVMAGIGVETGEAKKALDSVKNILECEHGIVIQQPPYSKYYSNLGECSSYPPGYKENAGIFCHNNPWIMIAETVIGRGDRAFDLYKKIAPAYRESISEVHRNEPYVYSQMIAGKDASRMGEAKNSWLTGTAAWNFVAISQAILGVKPGFDGLIVDPCIPSSWKQYSVTRVFRGATYEISIKNPDGKQKGVKSIICDGSAIDGNVLPVFEKGTTHKVEVVLG